MLNSLLFRSTAGIMALAVSLSVMPMHAMATEDAASTTGVSAAEESVVASQSDTPLERHAKLNRAWVVFREKGSTQIWALTRDGKKREIQTLLFFSAFDANYHIKLVKDGRLDEIPTGDPITSITGLNADDFRKAPSRCRLVKVTDNAAVWLVCGGKRRVIIREGVFHRFGWEFRDVETITQAELDAIPAETSVDEETVFDEGVEVETSHARKLTDQVKERLELRGKNTTRSRLVKPIGRPEVFVITPDGKKRHVKDLEAVRKHRLELKDITEVSEDEIEAIPEGDEVTEGTGL